MSLHRVFYKNSISSFMCNGMILRICFLTYLFSLMTGGMSHSQAANYTPKKLVCGHSKDLINCARLLPSAVRFEPVKHTPYQAGYDQSGTLIGWVVLSTDVVDIQAYSGKPLVTLVGVNIEGIISGVEVIHHSEPILLLGIPDMALDHFVDCYRGRSVSSRVVVGRSHESGVESVDGISGATVTVLAQNQTILTVARQLSLDVGIEDEEWRY